VHSAGARHVPPLSIQSRRKNEPVLRCRNGTTRSILGLNEAFNADTRTNKVNLGVGVYCNEEGKIPLLRAVVEAETIRVAQHAAWLLPIDRHRRLRPGRAKLFGNDSPLIAAGRVITTQAVGGTGALKIGADFLKQLLPNAVVAISDPSWENHRALFETAGFGTELPLLRRRHPRREPRRHARRPERPAKRLDRCAARLLPQPDRRRPEPGRLENVLEGQAKGHVPFLDMAYQGFGDGIDEDAAAVRLFAESGLTFFVSSSFSKSFSLYGERVGALSIVSESKEEKRACCRRSKRVIRTNYSNPPTHGASIAAVLNSPELRAQWEAELAEMRLRIRGMRSRWWNCWRKAHRSATSACGRQRGMFSYSGLTVEQVHRLRNEFGIYALDTGRICVAALNQSNINVVTDAIVQVI
jgi:aromatic-amino-acid transaminase